MEVSGGALGLARGVRVDVREFRAWAQRVLDPNAVLDDVMAPELGLRGELLPGWYEDWVLLERERLRQLRLHTLEAMADRLARAGRYGEAVQAAYVAVGMAAAGERAPRRGTRPSRRRQHRRGDTRTEGLLRVAPPRTRVGPIP